MQRLACRPCLNYQHPRILQAVRLNSGEAADIGRPKNSDIQRPTKTRIASQWGDIVIPSREEISSRASYHPDLGYLKGGDAATSLAGRLAQKWKKSDAEPQSHKGPQKASQQKSRPQLKEHRRAKPHNEQQTRQPIPSPPGAPSPEVVRKPRGPRVDHTIAQRRAERLAREEAGEKIDRQLGSPNKYQRSTWKDRDQFEGTGMLGAMFSQPSADALPHRRGAMDGSGTRERRVGRSNIKPRGGARGGPGRALVSSRPKRSSDDGGIGDISLEIIEDGGDDKEPAGFKNPETYFVDLDKIFGQPPTTHDITTTQQDLQRVVGHPQWARETFGGDYSRFASSSLDTYTVSHRKLGPLKHAEVVLAKQQDVDIGARHRALKIVASSVGVNTDLMKRV